MFRYLQKIGKSLMVPVAVLPAAAVLMGIGYWIDPTGWGGNSALASFLITAGASLIDNMAILFAIGVAFGMSKDQAGAAALSGLVGYLVITHLLAPGSVGGMLGRELTQAESMAFGRIGNPFVGIISGLVAANMYNRFFKTELPDFLAFFSGRRLVPIVTSAVMILVSGVFLFIWPAIFGGLLAFGESIVGMGVFGAGVFGFFNRLLIPIGMHHTLNAVFWFDFVGVNDLGKFWGGLESGGVIGTTGMYMAGFFPVMMFGLPGACLAMWRTAKDKNKKIVYGIMMSAAFASFFTGVTEPIEFSFMFVAPLLYIVHALLTAVSMVVCASFSWLAGFGFSAGMIDMVLSTRIPYATNWWMLLIFGVVYFFVYYFLFSFLIKKFNLKTPGREDDDDADAEMKIDLKTSDWGAMAGAFVDALGGIENITEADNCATRLRLSVKDSTIVSDKKLKAAGAAGVVKPGKTEVQVIVGPKVQFVTDEIKKML